MFRLMSKIATTAATVTRWAPLGLHAKVRQHITYGPQTVPVRLFAGVTTNNNRIEPRIENLERKLGAYENYLFETGLDKAWSSFSSCCVIRSEIELNPEQIMRAFTNLQKRQKIMRVAVTLKEGENYFTEVPDAPDVEFLQTTDRRAVVASDHQQRFTFGQLPWRCKVLTPEISDKGYFYPFIFTIQACLLDAPSFFGNVYTDLINFLDKSVYQDGYNNIKSQPILPAREHLLDQYPDSRFDNVPPNDWTSNYALALKLHEMHKPSHPEPCYGITDFQLDTEQTSQLLQAVEKHNVSLNCTCVAAHAMALYRLLIDIGILTDDQGWSLQSPFAVDPRRHAIPQLPLSHSADYIGELSNNITIPANMSSCSRDKVAWELATSIQKETRELVSKPEPILANLKQFSEFNDTIFMPDRESYYRSSDPVQDLFFISNFSKIKVPLKKGKVSFDKMEMITGTTGSTMFSHDIHRLNSSRLLHWELSYSKMLVSDELAERYISLIKEEVERYLTDMPEKTIGG